MINFNNLDIDTIKNYLESTNVNDCLNNCSNNGLCNILNSTHLLCKCDTYFEGRECQFNMRPCYSNPCLNSGKCIEDMSDLKFECNCTEFHYGTYCENKIDVCQNETCSYNGVCQDRKNMPECDCFYLYEGEKCEIISAELKTIKSIISITSIIAIIILVTFCLFICSMDLLKLCNRRKKRRVRRKVEKIKLNYINF